MRIPVRIQHWMKVMVNCEVSSFVTTVWNLVIDRVLFTNNRWGTFRLFTLQKPQVATGRVSPSETSHKRRLYHPSLRTWITCKGFLKACKRNPFTGFLRKILFKWVTTYIPGPELHYWVVKYKCPEKGLLACH